MSAIPRAGLLALALAVLSAAPLAADEERLTNEQKAEAFLRRLEEAKPDAEVLARVQEAWKLAKEDEFYDDFVVESLIHVDPGFRAALDHYSKEMYGPAAEAFAKVAADAKDPYLVAAASYHQAQSHLELDEYEKAEPLLARLAGELAPYTQDEAEAVFYLAHCQAFQVKREEALATLERFLLVYVDAPERYRITAAQFRDDLKYRGENELLDLSDRMDIVKRLLGKSKTDDPTQEKQKEIVEILDKLIKKHEDDCPS